jgi:RimJ/RimL family protein N-acetyltransferase
MQADRVALPLSDGAVTIRAFRDEDRGSVLNGRDNEWERWLGPGSPEPAPTACIEVGGVVVGWVDGDADADWLGPGEVNVGYSVFREHRGNGYAALAVRLLVRDLRDRGARRALLVIDEDNVASHRVARDAGARRLVDRTLPRFPRSVDYAIELLHPSSPAGA